MKALTFLHCGYTPRCDARVDKTFDYFTLQLMTRGQIELSYGHTAFALEGGWLWTAFPGPHVRFHCAPGCTWWEHRYVAFHGAAVREWQAGNLWFHAPQPLPDASLIAVFDELITQAQRADDWGARRATNLLEQVLLELAEARAQPLQNQAWLETILKKLDADEQFAPDYDALARDCGLGLSTLRRRFKDATGVTLHAYVMRRRIARARELLGQTDWPLKQIAAELNFSDVYFFSSQFRRLAGCTPTAYRKSRQF